MSRTAKTAPDLFTRYVRSLTPGSATSPEPELFDAVWRALRGALVRELKKRSLWSATPDCLGIYGAASWSQAEAVEDLVGDCYTFVFLHRLANLRAHLDVKDNVEGLVFRSIHNYLYDAQKKHDPLGFRVFEMLRTATRRLLAEGGLHVIDGDPKVRNETWLGFLPDATPVDVPEAGLGDRVKRWNDDLLPELVTARGKQRDRVVERLEALLSGLRDDGFECFRFKDVVGALKSDARSRWAAIWSSQEGETALEESAGGSPELVWQFRPDPGVEERELYEKLVACVTESLDRFDDPSLPRAHLERVWAFLRSQVARGEDKPPSRRKIAQALAVPRARLPEIYSLLGRWVERCREAISGERQLKDPEEDHPA